MLLASATAGGHIEVLSTLLIMWVAAKVMAEVFERLRQPGVVGEILAGVLIGSSVLANPTRERGVGYALALPLIMTGASGAQQTPSSRIRSFAICSSLSHIFIAASKTSAISSLAGRCRL